jgi:hypothetical protein
MNEKWSPGEQLLKKLMANGKGGEFSGGLAEVDSSATNVASQAFVHNRQKCCQFLGGSFDHKLDSTIGQVLHEARHCKFPGNLARGVAKTNPLHVAGVENLTTLASHAMLLHGVIRFTATRAKPSL